MDDEEHEALMLENEAHLHVNKAHMDLGMTNGETDTIYDSNHREN